MGIGCTLGFVLLIINYKRIERKYFVKHQKKEYSSEMVSKDKMGH